MTDTMPEGPVLGWQGPIAVLDVWCGELDRRMFREIEWPDLPRSMGSSHFSDVSVGSVDEIQILTADDGTRYVWGRGRFASTPEGVAAASQVADGTLRTVSVEIRDGAYAEWPIIEDGMEVGWAMEWSRAVIGAFALERNPAFAGAVIVPDAEAASFEYVPPASPNPVDGTAPDDLEPPDDGEMVALQVAQVDKLRRESESFRQAGAGPHVFPAAHFSRIDYGGPTRLTISADGEVTGYPVLWGKTHRADRSWTAAKNPADDLSEWLVGSTSLDDGRTIRTGVIVSDGLHAPAHQSGAHADTVRQLIESTASQVAVVNAWADEHGIAVHGSTLPGVTVEQATRAMAGCPSVDQRNLGDGRGFVTMGVLMVNTCGFTPGDAVVSVEDGEPVRRLVASAAPEGCSCGGTCGCENDLPDTVIGGWWDTGIPTLVEHQPLWRPTDQTVTYANTNSTSLIDWRTASGDLTPEPDPPKVVDVAALARADAEYAKARLKAAVAPRPK